MNLSPAKKERLISEISNFGVGEMKIRVIRSNPDSFELNSYIENICSSSNFLSSQSDNSISDIPKNNGDLLINNNNNILNNNLQ